MNWGTGIIVALGLAVSCPAEDWPQWRGPRGNGVSLEKSLPQTWSEQSVRWKSALAGPGASSPIVWGDRVFVTAQAGKAPLRPGSQPTLARGEGIQPERPMSLGEPDSGRGVLLVVECLRRSDGRRLWQYTMPAEGDLPELHQNHNLASPSPVTDGTRVYALFGTGQLAALDFSGKLVWNRHLGREYSRFDVDWGHGSSPVLYQGSLIVLCDHKSASYLLALNADDGTEKWKVDRGKGLRSYSTPTVVQGPEGDELIVNSSTRIESYEPKSGKLLWFTGDPVQLSVPVPSVENGVIFISRGYRSSPYLAIRPGGRGDVSRTHVLWTVPAGGAYVSSIIAYQGLVFLANDIGVLTCADGATGTRVWQQRVGGLFFASPVAGDGKVYFASETGDVVVVKADRTANILARNTLDGRIVASPAISGQSIFIRTDDHLYCVAGK